MRTCLWNVHCAAQVRAAFHKKIDALGGEVVPNSTRSQAADDTITFSREEETHACTEHAVTGHPGRRRGAADRCLRAQWSAIRNDSASADCDQHWTEGAEDGAQRRAVQPVRPLADRRQPLSVHLG